MTQAQCNASCKASNYGCDPYTATCATGFGTNYRDACEGGCATSAVYKCDYVSGACIANTGGGDTLNVCSSSCAKSAVANSIYFNTGGIGTPFYSTDSNNAVAWTQNYLIFNVNAFTGFTPVVGRSYRLDVLGKSSYNLTYNSITNVVKTNDGYLYAVTPLIALPVGVYWMTLVDLSVSSYAANPQPPTLRATAPCTNTCGSYLKWSCNSVLGTCESDKGGTMSHLNCDQTCFIDRTYGCDDTGNCVPNKGSFTKAQCDAQSCIKSTNSFTNTISYTRGGAGTPLPANGDNTAVTWDTNTIFFNVKAFNGFTQPTAAAKYTLTVSGQSTTYHLQYVKVGEVGTGAVQGYQYTSTETINWAAGSYVMTLAKV